MTNRHPQWEVRLNQWLRDVGSTPYAWGTHDCMIGTVGGVSLAVLDEDIAAPHRGKYKTKRGSLLYLKKTFGVSTPEEMLDQLFPSRPVKKARRGDLVLHSEGVPGVCLGREAAFIGFEEDRRGLVTFDNSHWTRAWGVGD